MAFIHVEGHGPKHHWCMYFSSLGNGMQVCVLLADTVYAMYCRRSCVICVFNGMNYSEFFKLGGPINISLLL